MVRTSSETRRHQLSVETVVPDVLTATLTVTLGTLKHLYVAPPGNDRPHMVYTEKGLRHTARPWTFKHKLSLNSTTGICIPTGRNKNNSLSYVSHHVQ